MAEHFKIVFEGQLRTGVALETARLNLAQLFKTDVSGVDRLFTGNPVTIKRSLTRDDAQRYLAALNEAGVEGRIEPEEPVSLSLDEVVEVAPQRPVFDPATSPYAPPRTPVAHDWPAVGELKVFSIQGRIGRLRYLAWSLALVGVAMLVAVLCVGILSVSLVAGGLLGTVAFVAFVVVSVQIGAQRLHDAGMSAWLLLLNLVPVVGSFFPIVMMAVPGSTGPNEYGPPPPSNTPRVKVLAVTWLVVLVLALVAGVMGGLKTIQEEVEATTSAYEQALPYDDDSSDTEQPTVPVDPVDIGDSSDSRDDQ
ncbi:DUF805 domain-containing protein [Pseudomonas sp. KU26590]|uniref:DUF805 domain-containing protein n=1 Tax=Pseudomonas sp. KU26590 TaxID=2991051 RepID=UPI00223DD917|nr:DUF805 domain-containing protein [Pseudomonas sp. KU26590]UZJ60945.1 DUF805 domain-containing protein [Pseudomonas sp. KU26590]